MEAEMVITETGRNKWAVVSNSGMAYTVRYQTKLDRMGCMYFVWSCSCPSRKYPCKHALEVERLTQGCQEAEERTL